MDCGLCFIGLGVLSEVVVLFWICWWWWIVGVVVGLIVIFGVVLLIVDIDIGYCYVMDWIVVICIVNGLCFMVGWIDGLLYGDIWLIDLCVYDFDGLVF